MIQDRILSCAIKSHLCDPVRAVYPCGCALVAQLFALGMKRRTRPADEGSSSKEPGVEEAVEELPSAIALAAEYSLYCAGEPHPMEVESHGAARCSCDRCSRWDRFVRGEEPGGWPRYEVITAELVAGLAAWLRGEPRRRQ